MLFRFRGFAAFVALIAVALGMGVTRVPARAGTVAVEPGPTRLPDGFRSMVVDDAHQRVFVSSYWSDTVTVLDFTGRVVKTLTGLDGANSMLLDGSTLYVVLEERGTVDAYDTETFTRIRRYGAGTLVHPRPLAMAGGKLWTSTGECDKWGTQLASIDLSSKAVQVHDVPLGLRWCIGLAHAPLDSDRLLAFTPGLQPPTSYLFDVSGGTPTLLVERLQETMSSPLVVLPGEQAFLAPAIDPDGIGRFRMSDLRRDDLTYPTGWGPKAVAVTQARGGLLAAGLYGAYHTDIEVFPLDQPGRRIFDHDFGDGPEPTLFADSLAWSGDGRRLFAVSGDGNTGATWFHAFLIPPTVSLSVDVSVATLGQPVTFTAEIAGRPGVEPTGTVTFADGTGVLATAGLVGGRASVTLDRLSVGVHDVTATYTGAYAAASDRSPAVRVTVQAPSAPPPAADASVGNPPAGNPPAGNFPAGDPTAGNPTAGDPPAGNAAVGGPAAAEPRPAGASGYWLLSRSGDVYPFGAARHYGNEPQPAIDIEATPTDLGYWILSRNGRVAAKGDAARLGDARLAAGEQAVSLSATPSGRGYWVFTDKGRVFPFGDAPFRGDMAAVALNAAVLGSVATPSGQGYWIVASDGGVFAFGDARFSGSMGGHRLNRPVMAMAADPDGSGYWLIASDGGVFAFDAPFHGSTGGLRLNRPITGIVPGPAGYLMVAEDGGTFAFGAVPFHGSLAANPPADPIVAVALTR